MVNSALSSWIANPICKVRWAGWESDTLTLQRHGWQIAAENYRSMDRDSMQMRLALKYEPREARGQSYTTYEAHKAVAPFYAVGMAEYDYSFIRQILDNGHQGYRILTETAFQFGAMANNYHVEVRGQERFDFEPIDARPQFMSGPRDVRHIEDFRIFQPVDRNPEIIVDPNDVPGMMERILELQSPKQREIREKARKEATRGQFRDGHRQVHAQIISIA